MSEFSLDEIVGLQGWFPDDIAENRQGRLSPAQKARLLTGVSELFGLVHIRMAPKQAIEAGIIESHVGVSREWEGANMNGASLKLTVDDRLYFWSLDLEQVRARALAAPDVVLARRQELLAHWVAQQQRLRVYSLGETLIAAEPVSA